MTTLAFRK
ncbi:2-succinyl-6-hydroxy-2,4-cyclohexadiene-1-carboxylate synthase, partial [Yersinia pestis PY-25]